MKYLFFLLFILTSCSNNAVMPDSVIRVIDWDTFKVIKWEEIKTIRLIWINAPESSSYKLWYPECYWKEAKEYLKNTLENKNNVVIQEEWKDKYWRTLAYVYHEWVNINLLLISEGFARENWYNKKYSQKQDFILKQEEAKEKIEERCARTRSQMQLLWQDLPFLSSAVYSHEEQAC